jgi:hypothetical protein
MPGIEYVIVTYDVYEGKGDKIYIKKRFVLRVLSYFLLSHLLASYLILS